MAFDLDEINWCLWAGSVGLESAIEDRLIAAAAGGFTRLSLSPLDVARAEAAGTSARELGRRIRDQGLGVVLDPVMNWHPHDGVSASRFAGVSMDEAMRMSADLEAVSMTLLAMTSATVPVAELAGPFAAACDRAASHGALAHLEFIPMTVVADLAIAWDIVRVADRPNGGLVFDTWHFFRGNPDFEVLAGIPGDRIFTVQLDDAHAEVRGSLWEDTQHRLLPGDGSFDLVRVIRALADIGALDWVGPEVIHPDLAALPPEVAGRLVADRAHEIVRVALESVPA